MIQHFMLNFVQFIAMMTDASQQELLEMLQEDVNQVNLKEDVIMEFVDFAVVLTAIVDNLIPSTVHSLFKLA